MRRTWISAATASLVTTAPGWVAAQVDCPAPNGTYETAGPRRDYRINVASLQTLLTHTRVNGSWQEEPLDPEHARRAIIAGADVWAEQTNARAYRYRGTSSRTDLPETLAECQAQGIDYSLVVSTEDPWWGCAVTRGRCKDENGVAHQFTLQVARLKDGAVECVLEPAGEHSPREFDLQRLMSHEFGHPLGLGHQDSDAIMAEVRQGSYGRGRDAYERDVLCTRQVTGERQTTGYVRQISGGVVTNETPYTWHVPISNSAVGMGNFSGTPRWRSVSKHSVCPFWLDDFNLSSLECVDDPVADALAVFTPATWREQPSVDRVLYSTIEEYGTEEVHQVRVRRSVDGFHTETDALLEECTNSTGFLSCSTSEPVQSAKRLAVAWDDYNSRSVSAWVHQDRSEMVNPVRVAVGLAGDALLPQAATIPASASSGTALTSTVAPGLACKAYEAANYDCILAVVPGDDPLRRVTIYRFWAQETSAGYTLHVDSNVTTLDGSTGSQIAAWYHDGDFWLAYRSMDAGQHVQAMRSPDSVNWTALSASTFGYSDTGPTVASYWTGDNVLGYTR